MLVNVKLVFPRVLFLIVILVLEDEAAAVHGDNIVNIFFRVGGQDAKAFTRRQSNFQEWIKHFPISAETAQFNLFGAFFNAVADNRDTAHKCLHLEVQVSDFLAQIGVGRQVHSLILKQRRHVLRGLRACAGMA